MNLLEQTVTVIGELDQKAMDKAQKKLDSLTKPKGSLGVLEHLAVKLAGITKNSMPEIKEKVILTMAGDHGVADDGVSAFPQEVTPQMVANFINGGAAINVLARHVGARIVCVDVGIAVDMNLPGLVVRKVGKGTKNMTSGPAMTRDEAVRSICVGIGIAQEEINKGATLLCTGDMGIGNTTPSSAILAVFSGLPVRCIVGRGTGVDNERFLIKLKAIEKSIALNRPDPRDAVDVLAKVGGMEIGAIAGVILAAAANRVPVIIDGFISGAGALIASRIAPNCVPFIIASHNSLEPGHEHMLKLLDLEPMLKMKMRLGEGTGAALAINLVEAACKIINEMATFSSAGVSCEIK